MTPLDLDAIQRRLDAYKSFGNPAIVEDARAMVATLQEIHAEVLRWTKTGHILLHAGEMKAGELRAVKAVVGAIERQIANHMVALHNEKIGRGE